MMVPNLTANGSGGGVPGAPGRSVELQTTDTAIQWRQTGGEWHDLVLLADITGADGDPGDSVELRKTETAIQWRSGTDGVWADLVLLADLKGDPGDPGAAIEDHATDGYIDIGETRMAWGTTETSAVTSKSIIFPAEFSAPPVVQTSRVGSAAEIVPRAVSKSGFVVGAVGELGNPALFGWTAVGLHPDVATPPSPQFNVDLLPGWSAAIRAQRAGLRNARLLCLGDSTTAGFGALGASMANDDKSQSYPTQLAGILTSRGSIASWSSMTGGNNSPNIAAFDSRVTYGVGWGYTQNLGGQTLGAYGLRSTGITTKLNFAPLNPVDMFEFYSFQRSTSGSPAWIVSVDDVDRATVSTLYDPAAPARLVKTVISAGSPGNHTLNLRSNANADDNQFAGIIAYNSAVKEVTILNAGWPSAKASDIDNGQSLAWSPVRAIAVYNPDLVLINIAINDANMATPTSKSAYFASMQSIIDACFASGSDVALIIPNNIGSTSAANLATFAGYVSELADKYAVPLIDLRTKLGTYAAANAAGWMRDTLHPNAAGYGQIAAAIADVIMPEGA
jgi:lysophospholipase L1-like esterase